MVLIKEPQCSFISFSGREDQRLQSCPVFLLLLLRSWIVTCRVTVPQGLDSVNMRRSPLSTMKKIGRLARVISIPNSEHLFRKFIVVFLDEKKHSFTKISHHDISNRVWNPKKKRVSSHYPREGLSRVIASIDINRTFHYTFPFTLISNKSCMTSFAEMWVLFEARNTNTVMVTAVLDAWRRLRSWI